MTNEQMTNHKIGITQNIEAGLIENQRDATRERKRDVFVKAGAGSGKTRTLVARYLSLLGEDQPPRSVVAITFTKKAAREMRNRIRQEIHDWLAGKCPPNEREHWEEIEADIDTARIGTIHSLCEAILRAHPAEAQIDPRFNVLDEGTAATLKSQVIEDALAWSTEQVDLAPLFQWIETRELELVLDTLLQNRLEAQTIFAQKDVASNWNVAFADALDRFSGKVASSIDLMDGLVASGQLMSDAGDKLAAQVQALLEQWALFEHAYKGGDYLVAARALFTIRREHSRLNIGKKTSAAKSALAEFREAYDTFIDSWVGGAKSDDDSPNELTEASVAHALPLLAKLFDHARQAYQDARDARHALDFDDLEKRALDLLENSDIRARWQSQIDAMLVDEFQDTNERQRKIVEHLAGVGEKKTGRLFVVGDAKQSIYRFRGADVTVFRDLENNIRARGGLPLVLDQTFRAHRSLITALNEMLESAMNEVIDSSRDFVIPFEPLQWMRAEPGNRISSPYIEFLCGIGDEAKESEARLLARRLRELHENEGVDYGDVVLLFRASTGFPKYEDALQSAGIPFVTVAGRGFYDRPEVRDLLNILRALADPWDDLAMAGLLRSPAFGLTDGALYQLRWSNGKQPVNYRTALKNDMAYLSEIDRKQSERANKIVERLAGWVDRTSVAELLKQILDETNYLAVLAAEESGARLQRNVEKLLADAHTSELVHVTEFLEYIESLQEAGAREGEAPTDAGGSARLMTVHKSKGLEFDVVVLADASRGRMSFKDPVVLSPDLGVAPKLGRLDTPPLIFKLARANESERADAEDLRLLYVAATRAKDKLIVCGNAGRRNSSAWFDRLIQAAGIDVEQAVNAPDEWREFILGKSNEPVRVMASAIDAVNVVKGIVDDDKRRNALKQAVSLYEPIVSTQVEQVGENVEKQKKSRRVTGRYHADGTVLGTLVHAAIRRWRFEGDMLNQLLQAEAYGQGIVVESELKTTLNEARELLSRFRNEVRWAEIDSAERRHELPYMLTSNDFPASGIIDLLYRNGDGKWVIVDFKTDTVNETEMRELIETKYGYQVRRYREAIKRLLKETAETWLCFMNCENQVRWEKVD